MADDMRRAERLAEGAPIDLLADSWHAEIEIAAHIAIQRVLAQGPLHTERRSCEVSADAA